MRSRGRPVLIGASGVDGSGKSTLVANLVGRGAASAERPLALYLYGCVICRRWGGGRSLTATAAGRHWPVRAVLGRARALHAHVDAAEMTIRLLAATFRASRSGRSQLIFTDRSPLDGLVKHDPAPHSLAARWYLGLAGRYRVLLWLDGDPAALAARDPEHSAEDLVMAQERFRTWSARLPNVVRIQTTGATIAEVSALAVQAAEPDANPPSAGSVPP